MGPEYWNLSRTTKLKKCSERKSESCDTTETDGCCAVIPCSYCLTWVPEEGGSQYGTAEFSGTAWSGTVASAAFLGYWERVEGVCYFVVTLDGVEIYRKDCYDGQSCRDSTDSAPATIDEITGTLFWDRVEHRPLEYVINEDGCTTWFCNECECSCKTLCATLVTASPGCCRVKFRMIDVSYPCDAPMWSAETECNSVAYDVVVTLSRREYDGQCMIGGTINGNTLEAVELNACIGWTAVLTAADGTSLSVECDTCDCESSDCTTGCCWPLAFDEQYPCGYRIPVPFEIDAPGCSIDGFTGEFTPTGLATRGTCGECGSVPAVQIGILTGVKKVPVPGLGYCNDTPCGVDLELMLACDDGETQPYGTEECCGKMRLWVGTSQRMAGWDGTSPSGGSTNRYWIKVAPSSCSCLSDSGGITAIFDVALTLDCPEVYPDGGCVGLPKDCCDPICAGFTVVI
jgi:hypothetical protein